MEKKRQEPEKVDEPVHGRSGSMEQEIKRENSPNVRRSGKELIGGK